MTSPSLSNETKRETLDALDEYGSQAEAARVLGIARSTFRNRLRAALSDPPPPEIGLPDLPEDDIPTSEIIDIQCRRFDKRHAHEKARTWFPVSVPEKKPFGVAFVGDPHVDDNGCNWPLLKRDMAMLANTEGMYAINLGDSANNWVGRLSRLYADQDTSKQTMRKLVKWMMRDAGVRWLVWLMGNHDMWSDDFTTWQREVGAQRLVMQDWQARFKLVFNGDQSIRIHAAHNFPGNSIWNTLHGPQRAAHTKTMAHIYACGHTHNWAIHQEESASRDFTYWLVRARGYKFIDSHAENLGHFPQDGGATITAIINPEATTESGLIQVFADMEQAVSYLKWLR